MKKIIALLVTCLSITAAHAAIVATQPNKSGGRIELSNTSVPMDVQKNTPACKGALIAKSWGDGIDNIYGCWIVMGDTISIHWPAGERTYPISNFTLTKEGQDALNSSK